jgi:exodeoxyribonuclease VII small subunit
MEQSAAKPTFESTLADLDAVVRAMESGKVPLEKMLDNYAEGMRLKGECERILKEADDRVAAIRARGRG